MFTIQHMREKHPLAVAIHLSRTEDQHKVTGIAMKVFDSCTGMAIGDFESLITENIEQQGVSLKLGSFFKRCGLFNRPFTLLSFNNDERLLPRIFPEGIFSDHPHSMIRQRELQPVRISHLNFKVVESHHMGFLEGCLEIELFPLPFTLAAPFTYDQMMNIHHINSNHQLMSPKKMIDDMHLIYCKILRDHPVEDAFPLDEIEASEPPLKKRNIYRS